MTVQQAADRLEVSLGLVYKLCNDGRLGHERHGTGRGTIRITEADLAEYRASARSRPPASADPPAPRGRKPPIRDLVGEYFRRKARG
jgi:excisionase family DNA binding protein